MTAETQDDTHQEPKPFDPEDHPKVTGDNSLPGDPPREELVKRMIRVDQAGEYGAARIYAGQLAVLGNTESGPLLREMADQEQKHLERFNQMMADRQVRPTALQPFWHVAGFALGAATALLGPQAAMACTEAIEDVIDEHYAKQAQQLGDDETELRETILEFRDDEIAHKEAAVAHDAHQAPGYPLLNRGIKDASRLAIWLSERV